MAQRHQIRDGGSDARAKGLDSIMHILQDLKLVHQGSNIFVQDNGSQSWLDIIITHTDDLDPHKTRLVKVSESGV